MQSTLQAFQLRLPDARVETHGSDIICIQTPRGYIDIRRLVPDGVGCLMESGGELAIYDDGRLMCATTSVRCDGDFRACADYQAAVDAFLTFNGWWTA
jgi:hypothetical protein